MEKGYYINLLNNNKNNESIVAIHNKNGKGLLQIALKATISAVDMVAIHNKNGKGLLRNVHDK